ncbi:hypothetical protein JOC76_000765 [Neobacillus cucumis]|nr:hypothetical protein [Neobacillus cucumis]
MFLKSFLRFISILLPLPYTVPQLITKYLLGEIKS